MGLLQKTNLRQALIYIHFHTEDRILAQIVENFSHFGHAYAGSTVLVGPESWYSAFFYVYAVLIVDKCVFSRFLLCFIHRFFRLNPIARKNNSVRIFRFPVEKNRRKPKSCFIRPNAPSTWIERHILSIIPSSVVIFARDAARFSFSCFFTCSIFGFSASLDELHSDRREQPVQSSHL